VTEPYLQRRPPNHIDSQKHSAIRLIYKSQDISQVKSHDAAVHSSVMSILETMSAVATVVGVLDADLSALGDGDFTVRSAAASRSGHTSLCVAALYLAPSGCFWLCISH
jgi:hypothetical protein